MVFNDTYLSGTIDRLLNNCFRSSDSNVGDARGEFATSTFLGACNFCSSLGAQRSDIGLGGSDLNATLRVTFGTSLFDELHGL